MNFAEARCWPLPCLWVQQGAQNLCITSMLIVDLTHALEHVNPCNLVIATFKYDQFLRHSETLKPVALSLLISSWPLKHLKPIKPLARWQHFWRSSAEPKPAAWQVQRGSGNTAKDRNSKKTYGRALDRVLRHLSEEMAEKDIASKLLTWLLGFNRWAASRNIHNPLSACSMCWVNVTLQHASMCKSRSWAVQDRRESLRPMTPGKTSLFMLLVGTLGHSGKKANILLLRHPHARTNSVWPAGPKRIQTVFDKVKGCPPKEYF